MQRYKVPSLLLAVSVLTLAGVGNSSGSVTGVVQMMDFEKNNNTLLGYPDYQPPLGWYKRVANTQHLPAIIPNSRGVPPNPVAPCKAYMGVWNVIVSKVPEGPGRANALLSVLTRLSQHQCCAVLSRDESTNPATISSIQPVLCPSQ